TEISSTCLIGDGLRWACWPAARAGPVAVPAISAATPPATAAARRIGLVGISFLPGVTSDGITTPEVVPRGGVTGLTAGRPEDDLSLRTAGGRGGGGGGTGRGGGAG